MAFDVAESRQKIVQPHPDAQRNDPNRVAAIDRKYEGKGFHQVRCQAPAQEIPFATSDVDQAELPVLQVADSTMDQLRGLAAGPTGKVALFDQCRAQTAHRRITGNPGPVNAPTNYEQIELFTLSIDRGCFRDHLTTAEADAVLRS